MRITNFKKGRADLEKFYKIHIEIGMIFILLILIGLFNMKVKFNSNVKFTAPPQETVKVQDIIQTKQELAPPPPPAPQVPVAVSNDAIINDSPLNLNSELNLDAPLPIPAPPPAVQKDTDSDSKSDNTIFVIVERMPKLIGGIEGLQKKVIYPKLARQAGIEGRVYVQFIIDKQGRIHNPIVVRGIGGGCDQAALNAVKQARFQPGLQRGRPVMVRYTMPIVFKLQNN